MPLGRLDEIQGIDFTFDGTIGSSADIVGFDEVTGGDTLRQEIERLFNFTPKGSFFDETTYPSLEEVFGDRAIEAAGLYID